MVAQSELEGSTMPSFVIHVGPHKTGTTYIQRRLDECHASFLRQGIYAPTEWRDSEPNPSHTGLVRKLNGDSLPELEATFAYWESSGYRQVVISTEALEGAPTESLVLLRKLIGKNPFVVVFYVRAWCELLASVWNEVVVHGGLITLPEFMVGELSAPAASRLINIAKTLERFENVFGTNALRLVSYNSVLEENDDLFSHFTREFLGQPELVQTSTSVANRSFEPAEAELVRVLNYLDQQKNNPPTAAMAILVRKNRAMPELQSIVGRLNGFRRSIKINDSREPIAGI